VATKAVSKLDRAVKLLKADPFMSVDEFTKKMKIKKPYAYILRSKARALIPKADIEAAVDPVADSVTPEGGTENEALKGFPDNVLLVIAQKLSEASQRDDEEVNHPDHYTVGGIETIDFIEAKGLDYNLGNVVKYITRAEHKGDKVKDLQKAQWYLRRALDKACEEYADQSAEEAQRLGIPAQQ
jgi:hypothetical protein